MLMYLLVKEFNHFTRHQSGADSKDLEQLHTRKERGIRARNRIVTHGRHLNIHTKENDLC